MSLNHCLAGLKTARIRAGVNVSILADRIGVTVTTYYRYEAGQRRIYLDRAVVLASMLGCTVDDLTRAPGPDDTVVAAQALAGWDAE